MHCHHYRAHSKPSFLCLALVTLLHFLLLLLCFLELFILLLLRLLLFILPIRKFNLVVDPLQTHQYTFTARQAKDIQIMQGYHRPNQTAQIHDQQLIVRRNSERPLSFIRLFTLFRAYCVRSFQIR